MQCRANLGLNPNIPTTASPQFVNLVAESHDETEAIDDEFQSDTEPIDDEDLRPLSVRLTPAPQRPTLPSQATSSQDMSGAHQHEVAPPPAPATTPKRMPRKDAQPPPSKRARTMTPPTPTGKGSGKHAFIDEDCLSRRSWKGHISGHVPHTEGAILSDQGSLISSTVPPTPPALTRSQRNFQAREQQKAQDALFKQRQERLLKAEAELQAALDHLESIGQEETNTGSQSAHPVISSMKFEG
eukprot:1371300-Amphidinium_carterae.1